MGKDWTNMLSKISFSVCPKSPISSTIPSKFRIFVQRYLASFDVSTKFLHVGLLHRYMLETNRNHLAVQLSGEDDTRIWHNDGLFDVPRASIMDGVVHRCTSLESTACWVLTLAMLPHTRLLNIILKKIAKRCSRTYRNLQSGQRSGCWLSTWRNARSCILDTSLRLATLWKMGTRQRFRIQRKKRKTYKYLLQGT